MKLQLLLVEKGINSKSEFKALPVANQRQLKITLNKYFGLRITPKDAFAQRCLCDFWRISEAGDPDKFIFDFWEINGTFGLIFFAESTKLTGIKTIDAAFVIDPDSRRSQPGLLVDLRDARRTDVDMSLYTVDDRNYAVDFKAANSIPDSIAKWRSLLKKTKVSEDFINTYSRYFDKRCWEAIGQHSQLSPAIIRRYGKKLGWSNISFYQRMSEELIREFRNDVDWKLISSRQRLTEPFIREFASKVFWGDVTRYQELSLDFIRAFKNKLRFDILTPKSIEVVNEFQNENWDWCKVVSNVDGDDEFVRRYHHKFDSNAWAIISRRFRLSTSAIEMFLSNINWNNISENPNLTNEQLIRFKDRIDWTRFKVSGRSLPQEILALIEEYVYDDKNRKALNGVYNLSLLKKLETV